MKDGSVYVVFGETGEHEDYNRWAVRAFTSEHAATRHSNKARQWLKDRLKATGRSSWLEVFEKDGFRAIQKATGANPYDENMVVDYTGTDWLVMEIPLEMPR